MHLKKDICNQICEYVSLNLKANKINLFFITLGFSIKLCSKLHDPKLPSFFSLLFTELSYKPGHLL